MNQTTLVLFSIACIAGVSVLLTLSGGGIQVSDAGIPPTPAVATINVDTTSWFGFDHDVDMVSSNDKVFFVTDGSVIFNVTTTAPP